MGPLAGAGRDELAAIVMCPVDASMAIVAEGARACSAGEVKAAGTDASKDGRARDVAAKTAGAGAGLFTAGGSSPMAAASSWPRFRDGNNDAITSPVVSTCIASMDASSLPAPPRAGIDAARPETAAALVVVGAKPTRIDVREMRETTGRNKSSHGQCRHGWTKNTRNGSRRRRPAVNDVTLSQGVGGSIKGLHPRKYYIPYASDLQSLLPARDMHMACSTTQQSPRTSTPTHAQT